MAGYSKRTLPEKLGLRPGQRVCLLGAPEGYLETLGPLPDGVRLSRRAGGARNRGFIQLFASSRRELERRLPAAQRVLDWHGMLWVSWPKRSSGIATDLTEDVVRAYALASGLVDVKVCAIDETWSGLKLVYRRRDRPQGG